MKNHNSKLDHSTFHNWINYPNKTTRKCTICGCIMKRTYSNSEGKSTVTYERNNILYNEFLPCIKFNQNI